MEVEHKMSELDHPDQAIDTDLPTDKIDKKAFKALQDNYEGDPEEDSE